MRVGGGYETIDQFIENHCPFEVRKRQRQQYNTFLTTQAQRAKENVPLKEQQQMNTINTHRSQLSSSKKYNVRSSLQASNS